ncbi:two-component regulator propeller domain-containing protein [Candidatus Eisenbacteria bacterium]|uniref:Two-component regulator propeller domain-containing protein n=1 Tax=Eiseniibacteriota bacterium TaxID=2212470 RepID=A0ABV6YNJ1_UNCEI
MMRSVLLVAALVVAACPAFAEDRWDTHVNSNDVTSVWAEAGLHYLGSTAGAVVMDISTGQESKILKSAGGLRTNSVTAVSRDSDGALWMGTWGEGVSVRRVDGTWDWHSTTTLGLLSDYVSDIDTYGSLTVVATTGGISLFADGEFWTFYDGTDWANSECGQALSVALNDVEVLVGANCGVFSFDIDLRQWSEVLRGRAIQSMDYDNEGLFWIVAEESIYTYDGAGLSVIPKTFIKPDELYAIGALDTTVWVATSGGPSRYDFASESWKRNTTGLPRDLWEASSIFVSGTGPDDGVWMGTGDGMAGLGQDGWDLYRSGGPAGNYVEDIEVGSDGTVWCATGTRWTGVSGSNIGLLTFDGIEWDRVSAPTLNSNNTFALDNHPDGSLWVGFWGGGLMSFDAAAGQWTSHPDVLASGVISAVHIEPDGTIFLGEYLEGLGVVCPDGSDIHYTYDEVPTCVGSECITAIGAAPDGVMIGVYSAGDTEYACPGLVIQLDVGSQCADKGDDECQNWGEQGGWISGFGYAAATDVYGVGWLGTSGGLSAYDGRWRKVNSQMGSVWDIEVDSFGSKWVATDRGIYVLKGYGTAWEDFEDDAVLYDGSNSPLDGSPVKALAFDAEGVLWIGTSGGGIYKFSAPQENPTKQWVDVFPNPYYGWKDTEGKGIRFKGFLPGKMIRIYTVAGDFVAEIPPDESWMATNTSGKDVVPGVYIYHAYAENGGEFIGRLTVIR